MSKVKQLFLQRKKFRPDPRKHYVKKIRICPYFLYSYLDQWLQLMSSRGWHIVHCSMFVFWFEKGERAQKEYFTYGLATQEGKYNLSLRYPTLEKTYGLEKKKSKINSDDTKAHQIIEIDRNRIDVQNNIHYRELVYDRNHLYWRHFIRNVSIIIFSIIVIAVISVFL